MPRCTIAMQLSFQSSQPMIRLNPLRLKRFQDYKPESGRFYKIMYRESHF
jgi:hypothetical protein